MTTTDLVPLNLPVPANGEVINRFRYTLFPGELYQHVDGQTALMQVPEARACITELDRQLGRMSRNEGLALSEQLLGYFPQTAQNHDPKIKAIFLSGLLETFMEHSLVVGQAAVKWLKNNRTFLNQADLAQACEQQTRELRIAKGIAEAHLKEHARRHNEESPPASGGDRADPAEVSAFLTEMAARLKRKGGPSYEQQREAEKQRLKAMTPEEFEADTRAMLEKMRAEEPEYVARMKKANDYVLRLKARREGMGQ